jgi:aryl-alcohol dehydrogenase-like predicted oxidoreductase
MNKPEDQFELWDLRVEVHGGAPGDEARIMRRFNELVEHGFTTFDCADIYTGVERLDLVQFHWWDYEIPPDHRGIGWLAGFSATVNPIDRNRRPVSTP